MICAKVSRLLRLFLMADDVVVTLLPPVQWELAGIRSLPDLLGSGFLNVLPLRVTVISPDYRYLHVNAEMLAFFKRPAEAIIGRTIAEVWGEPVQARFCGPRFGMALSGQALSLVGWRDYPPDLTGGHGYVEDVYLPFRMGSGPVEAVVVLVRDFTPLKVREAELAEREQALRVSEALKMAVFDNSLNALVSADENGFIVEFNLAAEAIFHLHRDDAIGRRFATTLIAERSRGEYRDEVDRLCAEPNSTKGRRLQLHGLRANGAEFPIEMAVWRTTVAQERFLTASIVDLTERYDFERRLERQRETLRQNERLSVMGGMLASVAHELNNPLAIAMGRASLLEERCDDAKLRADATRIREATDRCGRIVKTFLNMARGKASERNAVDLNRVVDAAGNLLDYSYRTHGIELRTSLEPQLPTVLADADQLSQVIVNLLINAQQALDLAEGRREVHITTGCSDPRAADAHVWVRVTDSGPGIGVDMQERIFEPFFTTKGPEAGTGLGLSLARRFAREHGGDLVLEPRDETGGASFLLSLPLQSSVEATGRTLTPDDGWGAPRAAARARVLIVDDETELADVMRHMLEEAGFTAFVEPSGAAALERLASEEVDCVVLDIRMPSMDGPMLWRRLAADYPSLCRRTLFVTGDGLSTGASGFLESTGRPCLEKPFSKSELVSAVTAVLGGASSWGVQ